MKKIVGLYWLIAVIWVASPAWADFYVVAVGGRPAGTEITALPYTITSPGFYFVTRNLSATGTAITVDASNVTIDLLGFCVTGPGKDSGANRGIDILASRANIEIRNGSLQSFGEYGIYATSSANNIRVMGMRVSDNKSYGMALHSNNNVVMNCSAYNNGGTGIYASYGSLVKGCQAEKNGGTGISTNYGSTVVGNVCQDNNTGILVEFGCSVLDNTVYNNAQRGIIAWACSNISRNTAYMNGAEGLNAGPNCTIIGNSLDGLVKDIDCTDVNNNVH
jgi:parallel beta-helix repeat protein